MIKKCLKSLCILGLTLLPISFSNAGQITTSFDIPDTLSINNSAILTFNNVNFSSQFNAINMQNVFYVPTASNSYGGYWIGFLSWYDGKPYLYVGIRPNSSANLQVKQGFITKACMTTAGSGLSCNGYNESNLTSFLNAGGFNHGFLSYSNHQWAYDYFMICFGNNVNDYCFKANAYDDNSSGLSGSLGVMDFYPDDVNRISWSSSPLSSDAKVPDVPTGKKVYTNQDIIDGFNAMGLTKEFCYGGFPISNIFENGQVPQQFTGYVWGSGAMILDIWDQYKTAYNNDPVSFIRSFYVAFENDNYNSFYGYPKALYGFFNQYFAVNLQGRGFNSFMSDFTILDIWEYCNLEFKSDHNSNYTGDTRKPKLAYNNSENINNQGWFNFSGNNSLFSGNLSGFDDPKDFFSSMVGIFQGGLGDLGTTRAPLLPSYILAFLFAIILIRMISH